MSETVLAFDYGTRKIGVASGQDITGTGTPLPAIRCRNQVPDFDAIGSLLQEWRPDRVVVGLPLNMDGSESDSSSRARRFARQLHGRFGVEAWMVDERLSTREARQEMGDSYRGGADERVDSMAAVLIIESWFRDGGQPP